jgi:hypothetical protein
VLCVAHASDVRAAKHVFILLLLYTLAVFAMRAPSVTSRCEPRCEIGENGAAVRDVITYSMCPNLSCNRRPRRPAATRDVT